MTIDGKNTNERTRGYSAVALANSVIIQFSRAELEKIILKKEGDILATKRYFLNHTEAFKDKPNNYLNKYAHIMDEVEVIKG